MVKKFILFAICFSLIKYELISQVGTWTWIHGSSSPNDLGNYGTKGVYSSSNLPPARYQCAYWTDLQGNFWIFGGSYSSNVLADMWKYDVSTNQWTWVSGTSSTNAVGQYGTKGIPSINNYPRSRGWGANCWTDSLGFLWLYGGKDNLSGIDYSDLWKYNTITNEWTWVHGDDPNSAFKTPPNFGQRNVSSPSNFPGARNECKSGWVYKNQLILFAGEVIDSNNLQRNDLWKYIISQDAWVWLSGDSIMDHPGSYGTKGLASASNVPPARRSFTKWKLQDKLYIFGGRKNTTGAFGTSGTFNDIWSFDMNTLQWTWENGPNVTNDPGQNPTANCENSNSILPSARLENQTVQTNECSKTFWTFGGSDATFANVYADLWLYKADSNKWLRVSGPFSANFAGNYGTKSVSSSTNQPPSKLGLAIWSNKDTLYIFSGFSSSTNVTNDLWRYIPDQTCINYRISGSIFNNPSKTNLCVLDTTRIALNIKADSLNISPTTGVRYNIDSTIIYIRPLTNTSYKLIGYGSYCSQYSDTLNLNISLIKNDTTITVEYFCKKDSFNFYGNYLHLPGTYWKKMVNVYGCDSVIKLFLDHYNNDTTALTDTICNTDSLFFNSQYIRIQGIYWDTLTNTNGCDSFLRLELKNYPIGFYDSTSYICPSEDSIFFNSTYLKIAGVYFDTFPDILGCDSFLRLTVQYYKNDTTDIVGRFCMDDSFTFNNQILKLSGIYWDTLKNTRNGCDSFIRLTLIKLIADTTTLRVTVCNGASIPFNGNVYNTDGIYWDTLQNRHGCDSFIRMRLKYNDKDTTYIDKTMCRDSSYFFNDQTLRNSGVYWDSFINIYTCDSFIVLNLTAKNYDSTFIGDSICFGSSRFFNGQNLNVGGDYKDTLQNQYQCDSFIFFHVHIFPKATHDTLRYAGCFSVNINSKVYTNSQTLLDTAHNIKNCDSIFFMRIIEIKSPPKLISQRNITFCDTLYTQSKKYFNSGNYMDTVRSLDSLQCDSLYEPFLLNLIKTPVIDIKVNPKRDIYRKGDLIELLASTTRQYLWSTTDTTQKIIQKIIPDSVVYYVIGWDTIFCRDTVFVKIRTSDSIIAKVPTAFTPNGDGFNDIIYCRGYGIEKLLNFKIYNRWGQLLFLSTSVDEGWNGLYNDVMQNADVYFYTIEAVSYGGKKVYEDGNFILIR